MPDAAFLCSIRGLRPDTHMPNDNVSRLALALARIEVYHGLRGDGHNLAHTEVSHVPTSVYLAARST